MKVKKIYLIAHRDLLKGRSDCIAIVRMATAFSKVGLKTTVIMPYFFRKENIKLKKIWDYYGIKKDTFKIVTLPTPLWDDAPPFFKRIVKIIFHSIFVIYLFLKFIFNKEKTLFYLRGVIECLPYLYLKKFFPEKIYLVYDLFDLGSKSFLLKKILKKSDLIVSITNSLKEETVKFTNIRKEKFVVFGMGISEDYLKKTSKIISSHEKTTLRKEMNLPENKFIVTYTGKIYIGQREIELLIDAAKKIPDVLFLFIGGKEHVVESLKEKCKKEKIENVLFKGFLPPALVYKYQTVSDALVLFYTKDIPTFDVCSPSKLFEYMASNVPIIAVNSRSISEIIKDGENGLLVEAENVESLIEKINLLRRNRALAERISAKALKDVKAYTFKKRAELILKSVEKLIKSK